MSRLHPCPPRRGNLSRAWIEGHCTLLLWSRCTRCRNCRRVTCSCPNWTCRCGERAQRQITRSESISRSCFQHC